MKQIPIIQTIYQQLPTIISIVSQSKRTDFLCNQIKGHTNNLTQNNTKERYLDGLPIRVEQENNDFNKHKSKSPQGY